MTWSVEHLDRVARRHDSLLEHPEVRSRAGRCAEPAYPCGGVVTGVPHPALEHQARDPHVGDPENGRADLHVSLTSVALRPLGGQVLTEWPGPRFDSSSVSHPVVVLHRPHVDRIYSSPWTSVDARALPSTRDDVIRAGSSTGFFSIAVVGRDVVWKLPGFEGQR
jgi:hypothetical protein